MDVGNGWFENWILPTSSASVNFSHLTINGNADNSGYENRPPGTPKNIADIFPYIVSMGLITPNTKNYPYADNFEIETSPIPLETTGPFQTWYYWKQLDFAFETPFHRQRAISANNYVPENNLPLGLGIDTLQNRVFITLPKWKNGIPCTLAVIPAVPNEPSPLLVPYPNWEMHEAVTCNGLVSVYRVDVDSCNRLWVLDSGLVDVISSPKQACPPKLVIFNLATDKIILRYELPEEFVKQDGLFSNIAVDIRKGDCGGAFAYLADVWRFGLVVFSLRDRRSWRVTDHLFYPDPIASAYKLNDLEFDWSDGIFSLALSPELSNTNERYLFFHPMSSFREFYLRTSVIRNETGWSTAKNAFKVLGQSRGKSGQSAASKMDKNGVMFYTLVTRNTVSCWDSRKPYKRQNLGVVAMNNVSLIFPNDLKIDQDENPILWILSNRLPTFLYAKLNKNDYNFRIMSAKIDEAIEGSICDPKVLGYSSYNGLAANDEC